MKAQILSFIQEKFLNKRSKINPAAIDSKEITPEPEQIKIPELIAILSGSMVLWYALLNFILGFPYYSESPTLVLGVCISHYLNTIVIICCAIILYFNTVSLTKLNGRNNYNRLSKLQEKCNKFLNVGWLPIISFSLIQYLLLNLIDITASDNWLTLAFFISTLITALIFLPLLGFGTKNFFKYVTSDKLDISKPVFAILFFFVFCVAMVFAFSRVECTPDKAYYRSAEKPIISIIKKGYIFKPIITSIKYDNLGTEGIDITKNTISSHIEIDPLQVKNNGGYIMITYSTQIFGISKKLPIVIPILEEIKQQ